MHPVKRARIGAGANHGKGLEGDAALQVALRLGGLVGRGAEDATQQPARLLHPRSVHGRRCDRVPCLERVEGVVDRLARPIHPSAAGDGGAKGLRPRRARAQPPQQRSQRILGPPQLQLRPLCVADQLGRLLHTEGLHRTYPGSAPAACVVPSARAPGSRAPPRQYAVLQMRASAPGRAGDIGGWAWGRLPCTPRRCHDRNAAAPPRNVDCELSESTRCSRGPTRGGCLPRGRQPQGILACFDAGSAVTGPRSAVWPHWYHWE